METLIDDVTIYILNLLSLAEFKKMLVTNKKYYTYNTETLWKLRYEQLNCDVNLVGDSFTKCKNYIQITCVYNAFRMQCDKEDFYKLWNLSASYRYIKIPKCISVMQNLTRICLDGNRYTTFPPIFCLTNLIELQMGINRFNVIPEKITKLVNLKTLSLFDNQICIIPTFISRLTNLSYLCLNHNKIKRIPKTLSTLTSLQHIDLIQTKVTCIPQCLSHIDIKISKKY